ncbi:MAG TPA: phosphoesterase [Armatimonadetes bacterium]|nr:phosphoesterase [Armatimonadota bacterium]
MTIITPYETTAGPWLRGNLHTHTTCSDGVLSPEQAADLYAGAGYDFLAISDHERYTPPPADDRLVWIPASEVSGGPHILAVGSDRAWPTDLSRQETINAIAASGALAILNHPNWGTSWEHWPRALLGELKGYAGIEIYNTVIERLEGEALATDRWDWLLSLGRQVWGYANDDLHGPEDGPFSANVVQAEPDPASILANLAAGRCYASLGGLAIETIAVEPDGLTIVAPDADTIVFTGQWGRLLATAAGPRATYQFRGNEGYVRAACYASLRRAAYTQPTWIEPA